MKTALLAALTIGSRPAGGRAGEAGTTRPGTTRAGTTRAGETNVAVAGSFTVAAKGIAAAFGGDQGAG